jgi:hypothetical protein
MNAPSTTQPDWTALKARVSNRLSRHFCSTPFALQSTSPMVSFTSERMKPVAAALVAP